MIIRLSFDIDNANLNYCFHIHTFFYKLFIEDCFYIKNRIYLLYFTSTPVSATFWLAWKKKDSATNIIVNANIWHDHFHICAETLREDKWLSVSKADLHPSAKQDFGPSTLRVRVIVRKSKRTRRCKKWGTEGQRRKRGRELAEQNSFGQIKQSLAICA